MKARFYEYANTAKKFAVISHGYSEWAQGICFGLCIAKVVEWWEFDGLKNEINYLRAKAEK